VHISSDESLKGDGDTILSEFRGTNPISLGIVGVRSGGGGAQNVLKFRDSSLLIRGTNHPKLRGTNLPLGRAGIQSLLDFWVTYPPLSLPSTFLPEIRGTHPQMSPPKGIKEHHSII